MIALVPRLSLFVTRQLHWRNAVATQKPLVLINGLWLELPAADQCIGDSKDRFTVVMPANQTVAGTTLADITGLSFTLKSLQRYFFHFQVLLSQATAASTNGLGLNYSGLFIQLAASAFMLNTLTGGTYRVQTANNTAMLQAATQAVGVVLPITVEGTITTNAAGTLTLRAQRSAAATTVLLGSGGFLLQV